MSKYTLTVESDPEDSENLLLTFPDDILANVGWAPGDVLVWDLQDDGTIILRKKLNDIQQN